MLQKNMGKIDKMLRITLGILLIIGASQGYGAWMWTGIIPLVTGLLGSCPLYTVFGLRTCPLERK